MIACLCHVKCDAALKRRVACATRTAHKSPQERVAPDCSRDLLEASGLDGRLASHVPSFPLSKLFGHRTQDEGIRGAGQFNGERQRQ